MGSEANSQPSCSTASPSSNNKRSRDPEDEVYLDNLHSHKRYLTEMMASSLNCLTVGDSLPDNPLDSPARSESMSYFRDDASLQYSPMSEDSDDARYYENSVNMCSSHPESAPSSPVSPYRYPRPSAGFSPSSASTCYASHVSGMMISSQSRQRGSECEGRFPSSPSDICHSADLRRAALMRSVQMRTQSPGPGPSPFEAPLSPNHEPVHIMEAEDQSCSYEKSTVDDIVCQVGESLINPESNSEKPCTMLDLKGRDREPDN
ncbi:hypothetical protein LIER_14546 [Lithospermum erythrorhizon]|uniref:Uncharacterized protein n=1 Tax=Lithospermum erythrorhizon TaxID=34254 RepID=A0AAV3Q2S1_LITER